MVSAEHLRTVQPRKDAPRALVLLLPVMLACAGVCALGPKTGEEALTACHVRPIDQVFPRATLVSAICDNPGGLATPTGNDLYVHLHAPPDAHLTQARQRPAPIRPLPPEQRIGFCGLLAGHDEALRKAELDIAAAHGMKLPGPNATYSVWDASVPVMMDTSVTTVEQLRSGDDVWLLVRGCDPS